MTEHKSRSYPRGDLKELEKLYYQATNAAARATQMGEAQSTVDQIKARASRLKEMIEEAKSGQQNAS